MPDLSPLFPTKFVWNSQVPFKVKAFAWLVTHKKEQLDGAGIELPSLYKWIESQAPNGCCTEAWKQRPVRRRHGKLLEEGASGYLANKLASDGNRELSQRMQKWIGALSTNVFLIMHLRIVLYSAVSTGLLCTCKYSTASGSDGASIFLELMRWRRSMILMGNSSDPFVADAIANERAVDLSEEQKKKFKKDEFHLFMLSKSQLLKKMSQPYEFTCCQKP
ncbi:Protein chromatin remodeling 20 [Vitis vinifera]|uniref:Protein chromatin remodeling 20 n=1 Tax=Vitis vinifera TaxID=29760 RepID=A0A438D668_VITVI|nr:Protein chromatin remodeling 20 [Vitis vinifera]